MGKTIINHVINYSLSFSQWFSKICSLIYQRHKVYREILEILKFLLFIWNFYQSGRQHNEKHGNYKIIDKMETLHEK